MTHKIYFLIPPTLNSFLIKAYTNRSNVQISKSLPIVFQKIFGYTLVFYTSLGPPLTFPTLNSSVSKIVSHKCCSTKHSEQFSDDGIQIRLINTYDLHTTFFELKRSYSEMIV